jgi:hypothetical protein
MEMQSTYSAQGFSRMPNMTKNGLMCGVEEDYQSEEDYFLCPVCKKSVKL